MEDQEIVREFLIESTENLARMDQEMVEIEKKPNDADLLASIFRTIHTIKGTCGFLGFKMLERINHYAENLLSQVRNGERPLTPDLVSVVLAAVDATKAELVSIEATGNESGDEHVDLLERLRNASTVEIAAAEGVAAAVEDDALAEPVCESDSPTAPPLPAAPVATRPASPSAASPTLPPSPVPAEPDGPPELSVGSRNPAIADATIRVDVGLLDRLMNLVGELVLARNQILQFGSRLEDVQFNATSQRLNLITTQLQEGVMKTRMQTIGMVWNKLPRVVRDLASQCGKQINLEMDGADTELDKSIIEAIKDPLTHIVRNCCDHGIERPDVRVGRGKPAAGRLLLRAFHEGGQVNIEIIDDGKGIDPRVVKAKAMEKGLIRPEVAERMGDREAVNLVFQPGFSTAEAVTNISGRGVGMDVVKTNIEKIGGSVDLVSRPGQGTTVRIKIPLTLAIIPGLVITSGEQRFVIPQVSLLELLRLEGENGRKMIEKIHGAPVYRRRGALLPIAYLNEVLGLGTSAASSDVLNIIVLQAEDRQFGLVVDGINDTQEIVVKPLGKQLKGLTCYAGATIMGDGKVALILDVMGIGNRAKVFGEHSAAARRQDVRSDSSSNERQTLLLFRTGSHERLAVPLSMVARLEEFPKDKVERAAGTPVIQYRDQILPLVPLGAHLGGYGDSALDNDPVQAIVFSEGNRRIGLAVDQIVDIVEDHVSIRRSCSQMGLLGSAVVGGKVTDFIDLPQIVAAAGEQGLGQPDRCTRRLRLLLADHSAFSRAMIRAYLEMAGHRVIEVSGVDEAIRAMERFPVDALVAVDNLPGTSSDSGIAEIRRRSADIPSASGLPIVALSPGSSDSEVPGAAEFASKFDRSEMIASLERLASTLNSPEFAAVGQTL